MSLFGLGGGLSLGLGFFGGASRLDGLAAAAAADAAAGGGGSTPPRAGRRSSGGELVLVFDPDADEGDGCDDGGSATDFPVSARQRRRRTTFPVDAARSHDPRLLA